MVQNIVLAFVVGMVIGFIGGALFFRKNGAKVEAKVSQAENSFSQAKDKAQTELDSLKNKINGNQS